MYTQYLLKGKAIAIATTQIHTKCRNSVYPSEDNVQRFPVPDAFVDWNISYADYTPFKYTSAHVYKAPWADAIDLQREPYHPIKFNSIDGNVDRTSYPNPYKIAENGLPLNPHGRTGITGRGRLGRWGPNKAGDPIVTRWKLDGNGKKILETDTKKFILQFVAIQRKDNGQWALPGGMVDPGETVSETLKREFSEEALGCLDTSTVNIEEIRTSVHEQFSNGGTEVYRGYVDDPRNTDNAWMETVAVNFHDELGTGLAKFPLIAGDDAANVRWVDVSPRLSLYASHRDLIALTARLHSAFWLDDE